MLSEQPDGREGRARPCGRPLPEALDAYIDCWDPKMGANKERLIPLKDYKKVWIGPSAHQVTKIGYSLTEEGDHELVD